MELRQLRYFAKAAELKSFSEAAKALNIAQSTLSQQVRQLEDELNIQLFERHPHCIALTEAAEKVLPFALRTIHDAECCAARIRDLNELLTGELNIGVTYSFSPILTETIIEFTRRYPGVKLNIFYKPMAELMDMLLSRQIDFMLAFRPNSQCKEIESHMLFDNHLAVIVREGHRLAGRSGITLAELANWNLALPSKGLQARNAFDRAIAPLAESLDIRIELNEVNILLELIKQSDMITVLAEATVYNQSGVRAIPVDHPDNEMQGCVHMLRDAYRKRSALKFIEVLRDSDAVRARVHNWFT
jgi:LysR family cyn operon transcriptional activator